MVKNAVLKCQPQVIKNILKKKSNKVVPVIGDFDNINLPDSVLTFVLHGKPSPLNNVIKTLKEAKELPEIMEKFLLLIERTKITLQIKKSKNAHVVYSKEFLKKNWLPINKVFTRKQNGEHEYRFCEWRRFFKKSKLKVLESSLLKKEPRRTKITKNDDGLKEFFVNFKFGGFEKGKLCIC